MISYKPQYTNSWALVVGINAYQFCSPLSYASNDADAVASALVDQLGFESSKLFLLKDERATKQAILDRYLELSSLATDPDDRVFVFFAGHGFTTQGLRGPVGYLVPVDGNTDRLNSLIRWDELTRNAELIPAKHILFIIDACYSGLIIQRAIAPGTGRFVSDMLQRLSRQVITAGKADETVADGGGPAGKNSIFTGYLIEGLSGAASDEGGVLTANMLMNFVYRKVGQDGTSQQTPHYGHVEGDGDFILRTPNNEHLGEEHSADYLVQPLQEMPESIPQLLPPRIEPTFAERAGYGDPEHPSFGRNDLSARLGERRDRKDFWGADYSKAYSWLALTIEPVGGQTLAIDLIDWTRRLPQYCRTGANSIEQFHLFRKTKTTIDSIILYNETLGNNEFWANYLRLNKAGNIEYADDAFSFWQYDDVRCFCNVEVVGLACQFLFLTKAILIEAGFAGGVRFLFNLVGTRDTILSNFSGESADNGQRWSQPFSSTGSLSLYGNLSDLQCQAPNLQMEYKLTLHDLTEDKSFEVIKSIAQQLALAYNHQTAPRCFNYNSETFPWKQYFSTIHNLGG
jgi:hypothetical protein